MTTSFLPVGCFGKLPFWDEHLKLRVSSPSAIALREWVHLGRRAAGLEEASEQNRNVNVQTRLRMLVALPGSSEVVAAVLRPSHDKYDREFPFVVFTEFPRKLFRRHYALLPLALASTWDELDGTWQSLSSMASRESFEDLLGSSSVPGPPQQKQVQAAYRSGQGESIDRIFAEAGSASLKSLRSNLDELVREIGKAGPNGGLKLALPLSADLEQASYDATAWVDLFDRQFLLKRLEPSVVIDAGRNLPSRQVFLKFGALQPEDYADFLGVGEPSTELFGPAEPVEATDPMTEWVGSEMTFDDLLHKRFVPPGGGNAGSSPESSVEG